MWNLVEEHSMRDNLLVKFDYGRAKHRKRVREREGGGKKKVEKVRWNCTSYYVLKLIINFMEICIDRISF